MKYNQKGQLILTLILVMTAALAIGLSVVQRSLVDVSTSTKVEQSSRAFSAAEAGIEKSLQTSTGGSFTLDLSAENKSVAEVFDPGLGPPVPAPNERQAPLEYPPMSKEEVGQVWLADFTSTANPPAQYYTQNTLDIYWGNSQTDRPAIELTFVYYNGSQYLTTKRYFDPVVRTPPNNFDPVTCSGSNPAGANTYQCFIRAGGSQDPKGALPAGVMLVRIRLLYTSSSQPFAIWAVGTRGVAPCNPTGCWLPSQARNIVSEGVSGETQRKVQLFQLNKVVPPYFDYAIFSAGDINK